MKTDISSICTLPKPALAERTSVVTEEFLLHATNSTPLNDGYEFQFPGDSDWIRKLTEFVTFERQCCGGLGFELIFLPNQGPIVLRLRGGAQVKTFVEGLLAPA